MHSLSTLWPAMVVEHIHTVVVADSCWQLLIHIDIYTICGTPYSKAMEHVMVVVTISLCGLALYYQLWHRSGLPTVRAQQMKKA